MKRPWILVHMAPGIVAVIVVARKIVAALAHSSIIVIAISVFGATTTTTPTITLTLMLIFVVVVVIIIAKSRMPMPPMPSFRLRFVARKVIASLAEAIVVCVAAAGTPSAFQPQSRRHASAAAGILAAVADAQESRTS